MSNTVTKNPSILRKHWLRKLLPDPSKQHVDAIARAIESGVELPPIYLIKGKDEVITGWTRTLGHRQQQKDIQCIEVDEDQAVLVALGENTNRQSYAYKYQLAWVYCPMALKVVEESEARQIANLKAGNSARESKSGLSGNLPATLDAVADLIGVSRALLLSVKKSYETILEWDRQNDPRRWANEKQKRSAMDFWNARILDEEDPCTPGNAVAGLAGKKAGEDGQTNPKPKQLELFIEGLASVRKWGKSFPKFTGEAQKQAVDAVKKTVAEWPVELREEVADEIKRLNREAKEGK